jgi:hypothetical protein
MTDSNIQISVALRKLDECRTTAYEEGPQDRIRKLIDGSDTDSNSHSDSSCSSSAYYTLVVTKDDETTLLAAHVMQRGKNGHHNHRRRW